MKSIALALMAVCLLVSQLLCSASPVADSSDLSSQQRQTIATLASYILKIATASDYPEYINAEKRNAEVLNSLIGLPRLLKDKGR